MLLKVLVLGTKNAQLGYVAAYELSSKAMRAKHLAKLSSLLASDRLRKLYDYRVRFVYEASTPSAVCTFRLHRL